MVVLNTVIQGKKETLEEYVERFIRESVEVWSANDKLKCFIFENNLHDKWKFKEELGLNEARDMNKLWIGRNLKLIMWRSVQRLKPGRISNFSI